MKELEGRLIEMTLAQDDVVFAKADLEQKLANLKEYVLSMDAGGFNQVVHQAILLYGVSTNENEFDLGKDIFQGQLVAIDNIPLGGVSNVKMAKREPTVIIKEEVTVDELSNHVE